jgi:hypothetical protein
MVLRQRWDHHRPKKKAAFEENAAFSLSHRRNFASDAWIQAVSIAFAAFRMTSRTKPG